MTGLVTALPILWHCYSQSTQPVVPRPSEQHTTRLQVESITELNVVSTVPVNWQTDYHSINEQVTSLLMSNVPHK